MNKVVEDFLKSFFQIHNAIIKEQQYEDGIVHGQVYWQNDEEEVQIFRWHIEASEEDIKRMNSLCNLLIEKNLVEGDRITITENDLVMGMKSAGWDSNNAELAINTLMSTEVKMVDDGQETDSFFIHF